MRRRDSWGIPHVRAASHLDAFAGLGFAQAQDRLWQMEALWRRGTGRYADWVGKSALANDVLVARRKLHRYGSVNSPRITSAQWPPTGGHVN